MFNNPITKKRLMRFKQMKRSYYSFWALFILYSISLFSECICNNTPLYVQYNDKSFFPFMFYYPDDQLTGSGKNSRPDYKTIDQSEAFHNNPDNWMLFPIHPFGPNEIVASDSIKTENKVDVIFQPQPLIGYIKITKQLIIYRAYNMTPFTLSKDRQLKGLPFENYFKMPQTLKTALQKRFHNQSSKREEFQLMAKDGTFVTVTLSTYKKRSYLPKHIRLMFRQNPAIDQNIQITFGAQQQIIKGHDYWIGSTVNNHMFQLDSSQKKRISDAVDIRFQSFVESMEEKINDIVFKIKFDKEDIRFPFHPVENHPFGLDSAGRDVLSRIVYGLRISMTFGMVLVLASMTLGIILGAIQGYYGGLLDLLGQRLTEIWSALPFLYIMILMGAVLGRSFLLLLICYGMFNWIGISYYMRAEFLRLRRQAFVEAAQCLGLPTWKILLFHILPNALTPIITFAPFSLVGAIGSLAALDYLGFGLPPPTASWGEMLAQAQAFRWAWWLILYPSVSLFIVMLLGVFVGEGVRNAYDPKPYSRMQ
jgi:microcin C transport system permease protein